VAAAVLARVPGQALFRGRQLHVAGYQEPTPYARKRVLVVGGGNSGAQVMAELAPLADGSWVVPREPRFLPDDVDGRALFAAAARRRAAILRGQSVDGGSPGWAAWVTWWSSRSFGRRDAGLLRTSLPFRSVLDHLRPLHVRHAGHVAVSGTRAVEVPGLWLVGYGDWTGPGSATLAGVAASELVTLAGDDDPIPVVQHDEAPRRQRRLGRHLAAGPLSGSREDGR
jgi:putative flavoprotein involved in K+ transport